MKIRIRHMAKIFPRKPYNTKRNEAIKIKNTFLQKNIRDKYT